MISNLNTAGMSEEFGLKRKGLVVASSKLLDKPSAGIVTCVLVFGARITQAHNKAYGCQGVYSSVASSPSLAASDSSPADDAFLDFLTVTTAKSCVSSSLASSTDTTPAGIVMSDK